MGNTALLSNLQSYDGCWTFLFDYGNRTTIDERFLFDLLSFDD